MNGLKLQTDVLKGLITGGEVVHAKLKDGRIAIGSKYCLGFFDDADLKVRLDGDGFTGLQKLLDEADRSPYELGQKMYELDHGKSKVVKYQTESGKVAYLDPHFLKYFDKKAGIFVRDSRRFVCVYEGDPMVLVGIIFPVMVTEKGV